MNYLNYALMLENKKFNGLTSIDEAKQNQNGLDLVLSGENSATYKNQFAQLSTAIKAAKDKKGQWSNALIKYADGTEMIRIYWYRDANGKFDDNSLTWDVSKTKSAPLAGATGEEVDAASLEANAQKLVDFIDGGSNSVAGWVTEDAMNSILKIIQYYAGKKVKSADGTKYVDALGRLCLLYTDDENGDLLYNDINSIGETTWNLMVGKKYKLAALKILEPYSQLDGAKLLELYM